MIKLYWHFESDWAASPKLSRPEQDDIEILSRMKNIRNDWHIAIGSRSVRMNWEIVEDRIHAR